MPDAVRRSVQLHQVSGEAVTPSSRTDLLRVARTEVISEEASGR
jgi:hypothetical protein